MVSNSFSKTVGSAEESKSGDMSALASGPEVVDEQSFAPPREVCELLALWRIAAHFPIAARAAPVLDPEAIDSSDFCRSQYMGLRTGTGMWGGVGTSVAWYPFHAHALFMASV